MATERQPARLFDDDRLYSAKEIRDKVGGKTHLVTIWRWAREGRLGTPRKIAPNTTRFYGRELNGRLLPKE
jgi:hypothetical protein